VDDAEDRRGISRFLFRWSKDKVAIILARMERHRPGNSSCEFMTTSCFSPRHRCFSLSIGIVDLTSSDSRRLPNESSDVSPLALEACVTSSGGIAVCGNRRPIASPPSFPIRSDRACSVVPMQLTTSDVSLFSESFREAARWRRAARHRANRKSARI